MFGSALAAYQHIKAEAVLQQKEYRASVTYASPQPNISKTWILTGSAGTAVPAVSRKSGSRKLLDLDAGNTIELLRDGCCIFLRDVLLQRLRSAVDQVLGLLQTEVGDLANHLDSRDLVRAAIL